MLSLNCLKQRLPRCLPPLIREDTILALLLAVCSVYSDLLEIGCSQVALRQRGSWNAYGVFFVAWMVVPVIVGMIAERRRRHAVFRKGAESWVRITNNGVEYYEPRQRCHSRWPDVRDVWASWVSGRGEDVVYPSVVVVGRDGEFEMSASFFTENEVRLVNGLCKRHSGQQTFKDWRERPDD